MFHPEVLLEVPAALHPDQAAALLQDQAAVLHPDQVAHLHDLAVLLLQDLAVPHLDPVVLLLQDPVVLLHVQVATRLLIVLALDGLVGLPQQPQQLHSVLHLYSILSHQISSSMVLCF